MARTWLAVDKNGAEKIFNVKPFRGNTQKDRNHIWGTTAVAAIRTNRNFIGFELNKEYFDKAVMRIEKEKLMQETDLFGYGDLLSEEL